MNFIKTFWRFLKEKVKAAFEYAVKNPWQAICEGFKYGVGLLWDALKDGLRSSGYVLHGMSALFFIYYGIIGGWTVYGMWVCLQASFMVAGYFMVSWLIVCMIVLPLFYVVDDLICAFGGWAKQQLDLIIEASVNTQN